MEHLRALPPQPSRDVELAATPYWLGSSERADLRIHRPDIRPRHVAIIERGDGYWVVRGEGDARVDGVRVGDGRQLRPGSIIELAPGCAFQFGDARPAEPPRGPPSPATVRSKRRRPRGLKPRLYLPPRFIAICVAAFGALTVGTVLIVRALRTRGSSGELTIEQALVADSLFRRAYAEIELASVLLEVGASKEAESSFVEGLTLLRTHPLATHRVVAPRISSLEAVVSAIYRANKVAVPRQFERARSSVSLAGIALKAAMSVDEFQRRFAEVNAAFRRQFGDSIFVTGDDHPEHLSLYGPRSALDLRSKNQTPDRIRFIIQQCLQRGIRVKDFSDASVLRRQVQIARSAGLGDRAGTGLHLHIDRFASKDRWTVSASP